MSNCTTETNVDERSAFHLILRHELWLTATKSGCLAVQLLIQRTTIVQLPHVFYLYKQTGRTVCQPKHSKSTLLQCSLHPFRRCHGYCISLGIEFIFYLCCYYLVFCVVFVLPHIQPIMPSFNHSAISCRSICSINAAPTIQPADLCERDWLRFNLMFMYGGFIM